MGSIIGASTETDLRAFLIGADLNEQEPDLSRLAMEELSELVRTLGHEIAGAFLQKRPHLDGSTGIGRGKVEELAERKEEFDFVVSNFELSPNQQKNLEKKLKCEVTDRTRIIIEIFASHARTSEAKTQVELARLNYMLPRLTGMWSHLDRERGGAGVSRGMGEKQINVDKNLIRKNIAKLKTELEKIETGKKVRNQSRKECLSVTLVGYTNAGKSTVMNQLTESRVLVQNKLFATLDTTTRLIKNPVLPSFLLSDTVGFIREIPHGLIASFKTTLKSVLDADLLLHVVDASDEHRDAKIESVNDTLNEIGAGEIPQILVMNKTDRADETQLLTAKTAHPGSVFISALDKDCRETLQKSVLAHFTRFFRKAKLVVPYDDEKTISFLHRNCILNEIRYEEAGTEFDCLMSESDHAKLGLLSPEIRKQMQSPDLSKS